MKRILLVIVPIVIISVVGFWVFLQDGDPQDIVQQSLKQIGVISDKQTTSTNPLAIENLRKRNYEGSPVTIEETLLC